LSKTVGSFFSFQGDTNSQEFLPSKEDFFLFILLLAAKSVPPLDCLETYGNEIMTYPQQNVWFDWLKILPIVHTMIYNSHNMTIATHLPHKIISYIPKEKSKQHLKVKRFGKNSWMMPLTRKFRTQ